jgi:hypothetical protein
MKIKPIKKRKRLLFWHTDNVRLKGEKPCPNCGRRQRHFVGPMFGERGFYICENLKPGHQP